MVEAVVIGCGTSHGVPMIGCGCSVCTSDDPKNKRTRSAVFLSGEGYNVLIDAPPELRLQLCREGISEIERVLITHSHADHVMGMDDLRRLTEITGEPVRVFAQPAVLDDLRRIYRYAFDRPAQVGGGLPTFELFSVWDGQPSPNPSQAWEGDCEVAAGDIDPSTTLGMTGGSLGVTGGSLGMAGWLEPDIEVFEVMHGSLAVLGVKVRGFAYLTDVSEIPAYAEHRLRGLETLVIDATRIKPHATHLNLEGALAVIDRLKPAKAYLTHLGHDYDYATWNEKLPRGVELSYDGLRIWIP
ncbi:MAG: MBL fold metallo-hydrolase [Armatimonadota bacterium]|nr:MBL fold metallo-hydrolase [Armatimonadota bacterium]